MRSPQPRIVLLLVEGESDSTLLAPSLERLIACHVEGAPFRCDVTVVNQYPVRDTWFTPGKDVRTLVRNRVREHISQKNGAYRKRDVIRIIQVIDLDGAFIPHDRVFEDRLLSHVEYGSDRISVPNRARHCELMAEKRRNVDSLRGLSNIDNIPYRLFFVSRNLEHAFAADPDVRDLAEKNDLASARAIQFARDPDLFRAMLVLQYAQHLAEARFSTVNAMTLRQAHTVIEQEGLLWNESWKNVLCSNSLLSLHAGSNLACIPDFIHNVG